MDGKIYNSSQRVPNLTAAGSETQGKKKADELKMRDFRVRTKTWQLTLNNKKKQTI
jgi:hypothetical protein